MIPEVMRTPKSYWVTRRVDGHRDWGFGFWRELFQNSVDAGAKNITIHCEDAKGIGSFGRDAHQDDVLRVTFQDDGHGMSEDILRNVFLVPGETTKSGGDTGGFGTARIMLCFSQLRYAVRTNGIEVQGDGSEYTCLPASTPKGCQFEIDINPSESKNIWNNMTKEKLLRHLRDYLSMSQLPCHVTVNGEESTHKTKRGRVRRVLTAKEDNEDKVFASVHVSENPQAQFTRKALIRVNGTVMHSVDIQTNSQVIVEIIPEMSRSVLTDNRDGLKFPYAQVLDDFIQELSIDTLSALKAEKDKKEILFKGGLGSSVLEVKRFTPKSNAVFDVLTPDLDVSHMNDATDDTQQETQDKESVSDEVLVPYDSPSIEHFASVFPDYDTLSIRRLLLLIKKGITLNIEDSAAKTRFMDFMEAVQRDDSQAHEMLLRNENKFLRDIGVSVLDEIIKQDPDGTRFYHDRMRVSKDVFIHLDTDDKKTLALSRRYKPDYWRGKTDGSVRGMEAHMLLVAWTSFCDEALLALREHNSSLQDKPIRYSTGWVFSEPSEIYDSRLDRYTKTITQAQHLERDNTHYLLLNPVNADGKMAYDLSMNGVERDENGLISMSGLQRLEALAAHEVAHVFCQRHNEFFASVLTDILSAMNRGRARRNMFEKINFIRENVYGRGPVIIQNADAPDSEMLLTIPKGRGVRPADVLMAHAYPATMAIGGLFHASQTDDTEKTCVEKTLESSIHDTDDVRLVNTHALSRMETVLEKTACHNFTPEQTVTEDVAPEHDTPEMTDEFDGLTLDVSDSTSIAPETMDISAFKM